MMFSYALSNSKSTDELKVIEIENLNQLVRLCKKIGNKQGYFWPPLEEQLYTRSGYDKDKTAAYNSFCEKMQSRIGLLDEDNNDEDADLGENLNDD